MNTLDGNTVEGNGSHGIRVSTDDNVVEDNLADRNNGNGFTVISGATGNTLTGNTAVENGFSGFFASRATFANTLTNNSGCDNARLMFEGDAVDWIPLDNIWSNNDFCIPLILLTP